MTHAKEARTITEDHDQDDEDTDVDSALPALNEDDSADLRRTLMCKRYSWLTRSHDNCKENSEETVVTDLWQGVPVEESLSEFRVDSTPGTRMPERKTRDTRWRRSLDWTGNSGNMRTDAHGEVGGGAFAHTED